MPAIQVTPAQLQSTAGRLNSGAEEINSILSSLRGQVTSLGSEWQGQAKGSFDGLWEKWERGARDIQEALHGISRLTTQAADNYQTTETQIASTFS